MDYQGKVAVITGGASGIGRALAEKCLELGMKVVLADINPADLEATATALASQGEVLPVPTDVSKPQQLQRLADASYAHFGAVQLLFNNAGVSDSGPLWQSTPADLDWVFGVNVHGILYAIQSFVPRMMQQEGWIINTASLAGLVSGSGFGIYRASKHAVVALSETLHHELRLAASPLKVAVLCPAWVRTRIVESERNREGPAPSAAAENPIQSVMHKVVSAGIEPAEVASLVFAALEAGKFYILTHPEMNPAISIRHQNIAQERPPTDTFAKAYLGRRGQG